MAQQAKTGSRIRNWVVEKPYEAITLVITIFTTLVLGTIQSAGAIVSTYYTLVDHSAISNLPSLNSSIIKPLAPRQVPNSRSATPKKDGSYASPADILNEQFKQEISRWPSVIREFGGVSLQLEDVAPWRVGNGIAECGFTARVTDVLGKEIVAKRRFEGQASTDRPTSDAQLQTQACLAALDSVIKRIVP